MRKPNEQTGQVSRLLLVLAIVILVAVVITYLILRMSSPPPIPTSPDIPEVPAAVYETKIGSIRFVFQSAVDRGKTLKTSEVSNKEMYYGYGKDLHTGEKFIQVTVGAQNLGTKNIEENAWTIENIIDSENREYVPNDDFAVSAWLPPKNACGALLKPAFEPTSCTKIYEVAKNSTGLKIRVLAGKDNAANSLSSGKADSVLLDIIVK